MRLLIATLLIALAPLAQAQEKPTTLPGMPYDRSPLEPELNPYWDTFVNRDRVYDYYAKQALHFGALPEAEQPEILPPYPGLDGGSYGHWGNQNDKETWIEPRVGEMERGNFICGVFRGANLELPRAVSVELGDGFNAVFDQHTLTYRVAWKGDLVKWIDVRRGLMKGLIMGGEELVPLESLEAPSKDAQFVGIYPDGERVVFAYREGGETKYRTAAVEDGKVVEKQVTKPEGSATLWPGWLETKGELGEEKPYALDTLPLPHDNPWKALLYLSGIDFVSESRIAVCTLHGDVWLCDVSDPDLTTLKWKRYATGLYQPLGLVVVDGVIHVMCRDQLVALHDYNGDDEADFYECVSNAQKTSPGAHDFITGLQRDDQGRWYFASGNQGICRVSADGQSLKVLGTGLRNPNGLGISPDGRVILTSVQEGTWTPASAIADETYGGHFGAGGPKEGDRGYVPPMLYLPRGVDNSCGGQTYIESERWGPATGQWLHFSSGKAKFFLVLREELEGNSQAMAVAMPGEFLSGSHRGRFSPADGQLYVASAQGWGNYGTTDGALQRVRYTGGDAPYPYPIRSEIRQNGVLLTFADPQPQAIAKAEDWFAQQWNYLYGPAYGSAEYSALDPDKTGHDRLEIRSVQRLDEGRQIFLEIPQILPVDQLHLHWNAETRLELFGTVHELGKPFTDFPGYERIPKERSFTQTTEVDLGVDALVKACVTCHHPTKMVVGPPFSEIRERYAGNPEGIVKWAMKPENKNPDRPPMPSFDFLGEEKLRMIADYLLAQDPPMPEAEQ